MLRLGPLLRVEETVLDAIVLGQCKASRVSDEDFCLIRNGLPLVFASNHFSQGAELGFKRTCSG